LSEYAKLLEFAGRNKDMAFIESNNEKFLEELETLLNNIKHVLSDNIITEKDIPTESLSSESMKEKLLSLKKALNDMDSTKADKIVNDLFEKSCDSETKETLDQITQHILFCDYDDAIDEIDTLIERLDI
jgi:CRISPR/Cas system Type II protein with McrA/HNH and RuvC-like nuclease domain